MSRPDVRVPREVDHPWHVAINRYDCSFEGKGFMYEAKTMAEEVPRLALLFRMEREGKLVAHHHQCSHDVHGEPVADNHLTCCLGVECRKCPHLAALETVAVHPEHHDVMKAWTCATHIAMSGGDNAREGYVLTEDDKLYWRNLYASLAGGDPAGQPEGNQT